MNNAFAFISGDRGKYGVLLIRPILDNMILSYLRKKRKSGFFRKKLHQLVLPVLERLNLVFADLNNLVNELSGGNQQKVVIGRWLLTEPKVLLMDDPTKGVDIQAKEELYALMREMCAQGAAVASGDGEVASNGCGDGFEPASLKPWADVTQSDWHQPVPRAVFEQAESGTASAPEHVQSVLPPEPGGDFHF